jgi:crossover junction endodeoxyribonuclease RuvC
MGSVDRREGIFFEEKKEEGKPLIFLMVILGIDPGIAKLGYAVISREGEVFSIIDSGVFTTPPTLTTTLRLATIADHLTKLCERVRPDRIILERLIPGPHRNLGKVAEVRGVVLLIAGQRDIPVEEVFPTALKLSTTRTGAATKMQMRRTVQRLLGLPKLPPPDTADALALALLGSTRDIKPFGAV